MELNIKLYDKSKYEKDSKVIYEVNMTGVTKIEVKEIPKEEILKETDGSCVDDYNEYLIFTFEGGETSVYRNSYVDISTRRERRHKMTKLEETREAIFKKYPDAVIDFEYGYGEIIFYVNEDQLGQEENLHSGYVRNGKFIDATDF